MTGDEPVGGLSYYANAGPLKFLPCNGNSLKGVDTAPQILRAAVKHLSLKALLAKVREYFQGCCQGVAFSGCKKVIPTDTSCKHFRQKTFENALCATCTHINNIKGMRTEVLEGTSTEFIVAVREYAGEEFIA